MSVSLSEAILPHVDRGELFRRMDEFYTSVDESVAKHRPVCRNRGVCCRFESFGHRLYVTTAELAYFVRGRRDDWRAPGAEGDVGACPYQIGGLCMARQHRPLGCRIFFCDPDSEVWQPEAYERHLARLKRIGADIGMDYRYVEWLSALRELDAGLGATDDAAR
ncbi:MAG: hypothetical protein ACE5F9_14190 [Phycisphaerae bacterium]